MLETIIAVAFVAAYFAVSVLCCRYMCKKGTLTKPAALILFFNVPVTVLVVVAANRLLGMTLHTLEMDIAAMAASALMFAAMLYANSISMHTSQH